MPSSAPRRFRGESATIGFQELMDKGQQRWKMMSERQLERDGFTPVNDWEAFQQQYRFEPRISPVIDLCIFHKHEDHGSLQDGESAECVIPGHQFLKLDCRARTSGGFFENAISEDGTILNARSNFASRMVQEPMHWSDVVKHMVAAAFSGSFDFANIGRVRRIIRTNITALDFDRVRAEIIERSSLEDVSDGQWIVLSPTSDEFYMLLGTRNAAGVVYLLYDNISYFPPNMTVSEIRISLITHCMDIRLSVPE